MASTRRLRVRHTAALYTDLLSTGMYQPAAALWELIKNGWDAIVRLRSILKQAQHHGQVELHLVNNHPLSPGHPALIILDNGTGLDERSLERFLTVGNPDGTTDGMTAQKRVGRIAAFALIQERYRGSGFRVLSSTSSKGHVIMLDVNPEELANGRIEVTDMSRDDTRLHGFSPKGSFTMIVIPFLLPALSSPDKLREALEWYVPRYSGPNGFDLVIDGQVVTPPPLSHDLVIHWMAKTGEVKVYAGKEAARLQHPVEAMVLQPGDIYGFFARDDSKSPAGLRLCDAKTLTLMARAKNMSDKVPFPFGRPELTGDLFIHGLVLNQNTDRSGLAPAFLNSEAWSAVVRVLLDNFSRPLIKLIGDEGVYRTDPLGRAMREALDGFHRVWGRPEDEQPIPPGIDPPGEPGDGESDEYEGVGDDGEDDDPPEDDDQDPKNGGSGGGGSGSSGTNKPKRKRKMRPRRFKYKGVTYVLSVSRQDPDMAAELVAPNVVLINSRDPLISNHLRGAPAAFRHHVLASIIRVIERSLNELDPEACDRAVQSSLVAYYKSRS